MSLTFGINVIQSVQKNELTQWLSLHPAPETLWHHIFAEHGFALASSGIQDKIQTSLAEHRLAQQSTEHCAQGCLWTSVPPLVIEFDSKVYVHSNLEKKTIAKLQWEGMPATYETLHTLYAEIKKIKTVPKSKGRVIPKAWRDGRQIFY